jgi:electron transport complex protein RnfE
MPADEVIARTDAWHDHPAFAQLLGLCPLLAVTTSVARALGIAVASAIVLVLTSTLVSLLRRFYARELRLLSYALVVGALVSGVDLVMHAWLPALYAQLGLYVPLIATNCLLLSRAERLAWHANAGVAALDALSHAAAIVVTFVAFGALRELVGHGTLLAGADLLWGGDGTLPGVTLFHGGVLLATLAPGAFLALAFITALHRRFVGVRRAAAPRPAPATPVG